MSYLKSSAAAAAILLFASTANAESLKDSPRPAMSWSGMYLGIHGAYGWGGAKDSLECGSAPVVLGSISTIAGYGNPDFLCSEGPGPGPIIPTALKNYGDAPWQTIDDLSDVKGWMAGGQLGYLHQMGRLVAGAELAASFGKLSDKGATIIQDTTTELGEFGGLYEGTLDVNWLLSAVGRLGYAVSDNLLLSVHGGLAFAGTSFNSSAGYGQDKVAQGWVVGGQMDLRITERTSLFASYSYYMFDNIEYQGNSAAGFIANFHEYDLDLHVVKAGLNYKLN